MIYFDIPETCGKYDTLCSCIYRILKSYIKSNKLIAQLMINQTEMYQVSDLNINDLHLHTQKKNTKDLHLMLSCDLDMLKCIVNVLRIG